MLDFYKCYRAYVRGKIGLFTAHAPEVDAATKAASLAQAARYFQSGGALCRRQPEVWVFFGLIASGKSYLAEAWAARHSFVHLNSDRVRKELAGAAAANGRGAGADQGIYTPEFSRRTYDELLAPGRGRTAERPVGAA